MKRRKAEEPAPDAFTFSEEARREIAGIIRLLDAPRDRFLARLESNVRQFLDLSRSGHRTGRNKTTASLIKNWEFEVACAERVALHAVRLAETAEVEIDAALGVKKVLDHLQRELERARWAEANAKSRRGRPKDAALWLLVFNIASAMYDENLDPPTGTSGAMFSQVVRVVLDALGEQRSASGVVRDVVARLHESVAHDNRRAPLTTAQRRQRRRAAFASARKRQK